MGKEKDKACSSRTPVRPDRVCMGYGSHILHLPHRRTPPWTYIRVTAA